MIDYGIFGWTERRGKRRGRVGDCTPPVSKFFFFFCLVWGEGIHPHCSFFNSLKLGEFERMGFQFFK